MWILLSFLAYASASYLPENTFTFHGRYPGKCGRSGLYYLDEKSFIYCSNGYKFVQDCAPGSRNSGYNKFDRGETYSYQDFCDVNLVDNGYAADRAKEVEPKAEPTPSPTPSEEALVYHGEYKGKCGLDGLYFKDEKCFVYCSNGKAYVQNCAPGSMNAPIVKFTSGDTYSQQDFCDINLVDNGYVVKQTTAERVYKAEPEPVKPVYKPAPLPYRPKPSAYKPKPAYYKPKPSPYKPEPSQKSEEVYVRPDPYTFIGMYEGKCENDGVYYRDEMSFVFCVDGKAYVQDCAPGTSNSGYATYKNGNDYTAHDLCDVNKLH